MKKLQKMFLLAVATTVLFSCTPKKELPKNYVVPIDLSSSRDSLIIEWYRQTVATSILAKAGTSDKLAVLPVDHNSELWGQEIFMIDFSDYEYGNEYAGLQAGEVERTNFNDTIRSSIIKFSRAFNSAKQQRAAYAGGTDILGALKQCQKYFSPDHENIIVLLSDMQHYTPGGKLKLEGSIGSEEVLDTSLLKVDPIALDNWQVIVLTGPQENISIEKFNLVKWFWEGYFEKCNADLVEYSSGAVSSLEKITSKVK